MIESIIECRFESAWMRLAKGTDSFLINHFDTFGFSHYRIEE
jgi:hypothetical protein